MKQKALFSILLPAWVCLLAFTACDEEYITYNDPGRLAPVESNPEYVMFADTLTTCMVEQQQKALPIVVASTVACDYDRTFGVEVVDEGSNAIEGYHYHLGSHSITIPAGEMTARVEIFGHYENIEPTDELAFSLRLVMPEQLKWDLYEGWDRTRVALYKSCPFEIDTFTGWCVVTSLLLYDYPGTNTMYQRLVYTEKHPTEENHIIVRSAFYDGYDIVLGFDPSDPAAPKLLMEKGQVLSDEQSVFGQVLGDNHILGGESPYYDSYFNACQSFAILWLQVYVEALGSSYGTVGHYYNIFEWVSDEEAERLRSEEGM